MPRKTSKIDYELTILSKKFEKIREGNKMLEIKKQRILSGRASVVVTRKDLYRIDR